MVLPTSHDPQPQQVLQSRYPGLAKNSPVDDLFATKKHLSSGCQWSWTLSLGDNFSPKRSVFGVYIRGSNFTPDWRIQVRIFCQLKTIRSCHALNSLFGCESKPPREASATTLECREPNIAAKCAGGSSILFHHRTFWIYLLTPDRLQPAHVEAACQPLPLQNIAASMTAPLVL